MNTQAKIIIVTFILSLVYQQGVAQWEGPGVTSSGKIYILDSNVGIGTSNPTNILHLEKAGNTFITLKNTSANGSIASFGPVSTNGKVETQIQYQTEFGIRDIAASQWRLKFLSNGYMGIGMTNPQEMLHINGNLRGNQSGAVRIQTATGYVDIGSKNSSWTHFNTDRSKIFLQKKVAIGEGILSSHDTKDLLFNTGMNSSSDGINRIAIKNSNGNVGIGTSNPLAKLQIVQSNENGLRIERDGHESYELRLAGGNGLQVLNKTDGRYEMTFDGAGNVGIGTIDPNYKLEVEKSNAANNTEYLLGAFNHSGNAGGIYMGYIGNGTDAQEAVLRSGGNINLNLGTSAYRNAVTVSNSNGNVGIGTAEPSEKFHVNGTTTIVADIGSPTNPHYQTGSHTLELQNNDGGDVILALHRAGNSSANIKYNDSRELILSSSGNATAKHLVIQQSGNVGIGTATSDQKLTVGGSINVGGTENAHVRVRHVNGKSHDSSDFGNLYLNYENEFPVYVGKATNEADFYVFGKVGIGTSNPTEAMEVNGIIRSKEILVEASPWPDYVFAPEYNLRSLTETKAFIEENHHLPGIPSAAEVEENGVAVGDMQAKLLQKIEELTLYVIELKEDNEQLRKQYNQLKDQINQGTK